MDDPDLDGTGGPDPRDRDLIEAARRQAEAAGQQDGETATVGHVKPLPGAAWVGKKIGAYTITRVIASGGMGTVYEALQERPRRTVAVKLMRRGLASRSALRRFEYESQLLGRLRHPGIAQIYEAGTHDDGGEAIPFFAMEYIPNAKTITEYARQKKLSTRARLELFARVCDAVHHGHQKGIIHRDLKPSNILIDPHGQPRIIDFGVARSTDSDLAVTTLQTDVGQLIGTLQYMSPEQCEADPHDIDTRSDVYSLGVVCYELLCEQPPYDVRRMAIHEATRVIREQQPTKLSTINRRLRGDVETIALTAIQKERDRRYRSAAEFGDDIQRYLNNEPIIARPPSLAYQLRIFARKNKALFTATAAVFVILVVASVVSTSLYWQADSARLEAVQAGIQAEHSRQAEADQRRLAEAERNRALAAEAEQIRQRDLAETARTDAERQAAIAKAVNDFLNDDLLAAVAPEAQGRQVTVREVLDTASGTVEGRFDNEPLIEASIRMTLGNTYKSLGVYETAEPHLDRAVKLRRAELGDEHSDTLNAVDDVAELYLSQARYNEAEPLLKRTLELRRRVLGHQHVDVAESLNNLAVLLWIRGEYDAAVPLLREALAMCGKLGQQEHPDFAKYLGNLAGLLYDKGDYDAAEPLYRQSLALARKLHGEEHPFVVASVNNLALLLKAKGDYDAAEPLFRNALETARKLHGDKHPDVAAAAINLASLLRAKGDLDEVAPLYSEALAIDHKLLGEDHPDVAKALNNLAVQLSEQGDDDAAEPLYREALAIARRQYGDEHPDVTTYLKNLAWCLRNKGNYAAAEPMFREVLVMRRKLHGEDHPLVATALYSLGVVLLEKGALEEAESTLREAVEKSRAAVGPVHHDTARARGWLGECLTRMGRHEESLRELRGAYRTFQAAFGSQHQGTIKAIERLVSLYEAWGDPAQAAAWRAKLPATDESVGQSTP